MEKSSMLKSDFAKLCGVSIQAINKAIRTGRIIALERGKKQFVHFDHEITRLYLSQKQESQKTKAKDINSPAKEDRQDKLLFSNGEVSFPDIFKQLLSTIPKKPAKIYISTWQLGKKNIDFLRRVSNDHDLKILLDVSYKNRNKKYYKHLMQAIGNNVWFTKNHSKILAINVDGKYYNVFSSANFNTNYRLEFFYFNFSEKIFRKIEKTLGIFFETDNSEESEIDRPLKRIEFKDLSSKITDSFNSAKGGGNGYITIKTLSEIKIEEEIGKIRADRRLKELKLSTEKGELIEKETLGSIVFQYLDALNINILEYPEMIIDSLVDNVKSGKSRGEIIDDMRKDLSRQIGSTKKQIIERLKID